MTEATREIINTSGCDLVVPLTNQTGAGVNIVIVSRLSQHKPPRLANVAAVQFGVNKTIKEINALSSSLQALMPEASLPAIPRRLSSAADLQLVDAFFRAVGRNASLCVCLPLLKFLGCEHYQQRSTSTTKDAVTSTKPSATTTTTTTATTKPKSLFDDEDDDEEEEKEGKNGDDGEEEVEEVQQQKQAAVSGSKPASNPLWGDDDGEDDEDVQTLFGKKKPATTTTAPTTTATTTATATAAPVKSEEKKAKGRANLFEDDDDDEPNDDLLTDETRDLLTVIDDLDIRFAAKPVAAPKPAPTIASKPKPTVVAKPAAAPAPALAVDKMDSMDFAAYIAAQPSTDDVDLFD